MPVLPLAELWRRTRGIAPSEVWAALGGFLLSTLLHRVAHWHQARCACCEPVLLAHVWTSGSFLASLACFSSLDVGVCRRPATLGGAGLLWPFLGACHNTEQPTTASLESLVLEVACRSCFSNR